MNTHIYRPSIADLLSAPPQGPEGFTLALLAELRAVPVFASRSSPEAETITWMVMEMVSNAISSALGSVLGRRSGLPRERMLDVFGTSVIWPGGIGIRHPSGPEEDAGMVRDSLGMEINAWLNLPAKDRFVSLGLLPGDGWVTLWATSDPGTDTFSVRVSSSQPPLPGDIETVRRIFDSPEIERRDVLDLRKLHTCSRGMYHIPSFTGGGGLGLLECIRLAAEHGMDLDWRCPGADSAGMEFRLGRNSDLSEQV